MRKVLKRGLTFGQAIRIIADLIMLDVSLLFSGVLTEFLINGATLTHTEILFKLRHHITGVAILDLTAIVVFFISGFYSRSRGYESKFKALVVFQAVSITFLLFAFGNYLMHNDFIAPLSLVLAWALSVACLVCSRLWSVIWRKILLQEGALASARVLPDNKEVLVIGGAGYIGSALLPLLLNAGYKVRILDTFIYGKEPIKAYLAHPNVVIIEADFRQVDKVVMAVKGVSAVVHLGAIVGDPACALDESLTVDINLMATRMIAEVCKGFEVDRFVFASTCSVYGASDDLLDEYSKLNPVSLYAKTKIACERLLIGMAGAYFSPVILRFSTIFGLSGRTRFDLVVNLLTAKACFDKHITVMGGDQWRPFLHVEDAARSILAALLAPKEIIRGETFNVGSNELNYTLMDMSRVIAAKVPDARLEEMGAQQDRRNYRVNFNKIVKLLKFHTKWSLEAGVDHVVRAIHSGEVKDYHDPRFSNAKFLAERGGKEALRAMNSVDLEQLLADLPI